MDTDLFTGLIRFHILHHAGKEPLFGLWLIKELGRHGYDLSPGTLYPILHRMEERGYLESRKELADGKYRRLYTLTPRGREALEEARERVRELFGELFEKE
ncbi:MAG: PadR family transcriptional regulator [Candidatus Latescibacterota bacterium]